MYDDGGFLKWLDIFRDIVPSKTLQECLDGV